MSAPEAEGVFDEPWQAQAFALAVQLNRQGAFTWTEWAAALAAQIAAADAGTGAGYYQSWLAALETIAVAKGLSNLTALADRKAAWARAYRDTPHGKPVKLAPTSPRPAG